MEGSHEDKPVVVIERSDGGLGAFLIGAVLGAGLALLFAPKSGEETRRDLKSKGRQFRANAAERAEDLQDWLEGGLEQTRDRVEEGLESAKRVFHEKRSDAKEAVDAGKAAVHSARDELERRLADSRGRRRKRKAEEDEGQLEAASASAEDE